MISNRLTLELVNNIAEIERIGQSIELFADNCNMNPKAGFDANLVLEEIVTNIISYAYEDEEQHEIHVEISYNHGRLTLAVVDDGKPFNPLVQTAPDIDKPLEEREAGGLGIYIVRQLMDCVEYKRLNGRNMLFMEKNYQDSERQP